MSLWLWRGGAFVLSVLLGLLASSVLLALSNTPIYVTFHTIYDGALGSSDALKSSLVFAEPIAFTGLAAAIAFRAQVWNIGGEGQMSMGAFGAALVALHTDLPAPIMLIAIILCGGLCAGIWGLVPAALKVWFSVNEVLSTLMLNYVAILWIQYLVFGPWRDPSGGWPYSSYFPEQANLPTVAGSLDVGILAAPCLAVLLAFALRSTRWGFELSVVGHSHPSADYAAISVSRVVIQVMICSGVIAGLAGIQQVCGSAGRLYVLTPGYGYLGILVSWLAGHNPLLVLVMAVFYGVLLQGGASLQMAQIEPSLVNVIQALVILFALAGVTLARRYPPKRLLRAKARS